MLESENFEGKSILFLSPSFFGYEVAIKNKLVELGAKVFYVDDRPSNGSITKGLIRIYKNLAKDIINKYYYDVAERCADEKFDVIFLLNPEALPLSFLEICKLRWPKAYYVMYMWDSIKNRKHTLDFLPYCNRVFTFERGDAEAYGFKFKPLFYLDAYRDIRDNPGADEYDLCFMGTAHSDRYGIAREVRDWCEDQGLRCFFYFYIQGLSLYWFNKLKNKGVMPSMAEVSFEKMSFADIVRVVRSSRAVLDIQHPRQTGLTMRTLETLGAGKKLVTTNTEVHGYDFYDERQVRVIDRMKPIDAMDLEFFKDEQCYVPSEKIEYCSIGSWLQEVILAAVQDSPKQT
jgi:hypothetical protein